MRLDEQYAELLSGYYDDDAPESWDLGHLNPTGYIMGGTITRTGSGYILQISITNSTDKTTSEMEIIGGLMRQARSIGVKNWPMQIKGRGIFNRIYGNLVGSNKPTFVDDGEFVTTFNAVQGIWISREQLEYTDYLNQFAVVRQINDDPNFTIVVEIINNDGKVLKRGTFNFTDLHTYSDIRHVSLLVPASVYHIPARNPVEWQRGIKKSETFSFTIKADDLSDTLTMRIVSVNGKSIDSIKRSGYVGIAQESVVLIGQRR
jgi:hypothetical protein